MTTFNDAMKFEPGFHIFNMTRSETLKFVEEPKSRALEFGLVDNPSDVEPERKRMADAKGTEIVSTIGCAPTVFPGKFYYTLEMP